MSGALANQADWTSGAGPHNAMDFVVRRILSEVWTATIVRVVACTSAGGLAVAGTVDVMPLVNQIDGAGNATPHGIINGLVYFRAQGGVNAVIMDPAVGDLGIALFASRDISAVKATKAQANPGSFRRFDPADGIYLGGLLNGIPSQYIQFLTSGGKVAVNATTEIDLMIGGALVGSFTSAGLAVTGSITATGDITSGLGGGDMVQMQNHTHTYVPGSGSPTQTSAPVAGT